MQCIPQLLCATDPRSDVIPSMSLQIFLDQLRSCLFGRGLLSHRLAPLDFDVSTDLSRAGVQGSRWLLRPIQEDFDHSTLFSRQHRRIAQRAGWRSKVDSGF